MNANVSELDAGITGENLDSSIFFQFRRYHM